MVDNDPGASGAGGTGQRGDDRETNQPSRPELGTSGPDSRNISVIELQQLNAQQQPTRSVNQSGPSYAEGSKPGNQQDLSRQLESLEMDQMDGNTLAVPFRVAHDRIAEEVEQSSNSAAGRNRQNSQSAASLAGEGKETTLVQQQNDLAQANADLDQQLTCREKMDKMGCRINSAHFIYHGKTLEYDIRSLFIFPGNFIVRKWLVWLTEWKWFENFITLVILANSIMLSFTDYGDRLYGEAYYSQRNQNMAQVDTAFSIIFTFECLAKIMSMGFCLHKKSYLRDIWNWLDFFVVMISVIGWLPGIESNSSLKSLRTFRILRPLRSINSMPRMKQLIKTLLASLVGLVNVGLFLAFVFTIFAIFGTHQFSGSQYRRCRLTEAPVPISMDNPDVLHWPINFEVPWLCLQDSDCGKWVADGEVQKCGMLEEWGIPIDSDKPNTQELISFDIIGFNHVPQGLFTIFQALTLEGWTGMMYNYMDSNSPSISVFFFCMLVVFGSFFAMQLVLAQIMDSFARQQLEKAENEKEEADKEEKAEQLAQMFISAAGGDKVEIIEKPEGKAKSVSAAGSVSDQNAAGSDVEVSSTTKKRELPTHPQIKQNANMVTDLQRSNELEDRTQFQGTGTATSLPQNQNPATGEYPNLGSESDRALQQEFISPRPGAVQSSSNRNAISPFDPESAASRDTPADLNNIAKKSDSQEGIEGAVNEDEDYEDEDQNEIASRVRSRKNCFYRGFYLMVTHPIYNLFVFILILVNTVVLAIDDFPQTVKKEDALAVMNDFFTWAFFAEMIMKMIGLGVKNYVRDNFNLFDAIVVLFSLVDVTITMTLTPEQIGSMSQAFQALRALRLLRVIKLARSWTKLQDILAKTVKSFKDISNFSVLLALFMYIYALLGMEMFANKVRYTLDDQVITDVVTATERGDLMIAPRMSFDDIGKSLTTIFIEIMGEDWNVYMYTYVRPQDGAMQYIVLAYFLSLMIMGNIMLLSLFTAILLQNFEDTEEEDEGTEKEKFNIRAIFTRAFLLKLWDIALGIFGAKKRKSKPETVSPRQVAVDNSSSQIVAASPQSGLDRPTAQLGGVASDLKKIQQPDDPLKNLEKIVELDGEQEEIGADLIHPLTGLKKLSQENAFVSDSVGKNDSEDSDMDDQKRARRKKLNKAKSVSLMHYESMQKSAQQKKSSELTLKERLMGRALFIFGPENRIRIFANMIYTHPWFDRFILILIIVSTMTLAFETPLDNPKGIKITILTYIDYVMSSFFFCEAITKIIATGFIACGHNSYIRSPWNILDFTIVLSALMSMVFVNIELKAIKSLRILRVLRPLRLVAKNRGLKLAITSLFNSLPNIANLLLIVVFFIFLLSILCMTLFSGQFYYCAVEHLPLDYYQKNALILTMQDCLNYGGEWVNPDFHFDTTADAMLTLLSIQTTEGWIDVMWSMVDSVGQYKAPIQNNNLFYIIFCMSIMIFITLLFLNLFVGVVIETFNKEKEALSLNSLLRSIERKWIDVQIMTYQSKPRIKINSTGQKFRDGMIKIAMAPAFDQFIMVMIMLNTVVLSIKWYDMASWVLLTTKYLNYIFSVVFTVEAIIKLIAMRRNYFKDSWNNFDFIVVVGTWLVIIIMQIELPFNVEILGTILRTLRIGRVFRIVKRAPAIQIIFQTLIEALPAIASLGLLLALLFFMYAVIGIGQFGAITLQDNLNYHTNFQNISEAFLLLMRCATGEGWNAVMMDSARVRSILFQCNPEADYYSILANGMKTDGCGFPVAVPYFYSFTLIVSQIFLNLFIAIIIDSFLGQSDAFQLPVNQNDIDEFCDTWQEFDPDAKGFVEAHDLEEFIIALCKTECGLVPNRKLVLRDITFRRRFIARLEIPAFNQFRRFMFHDVMQTMARTVCEKSYNRDRLAKKKMALKQLKLLGHTEEDKLEEGLQQIFGKEYELDFDEVLSNMNNLDKNIDSVSVLTSIARNIGSKARNGGSLDINEDYQGDVYTSKHFVYGTLIVTCWREFIRIKDQEKLQQEIEPDVQTNINQAIAAQRAALNVMKQTPAIITQKSLAMARSRVSAHSGQSSPDQKGAGDSESKPATAGALQVEEEDLEELGSSSKIDK